jgi:hypothetical protein
VRLGVRIWLLGGVLGDIVYLPNLQLAMLPGTTHVTLVERRLAAFDDRWVSRLVHTGGRVIDLQFRPDIRQQGGRMKHRRIVRGSFSPQILFDMFVEFTHVIMKRKTLLAIKERAERLLREPVIS